MKSPIDVSTACSLSACVCWLLILTASLLSFTLVSCDPEQETNRYFAKQGLNRLAILRDDIQPGAFIRSGQHGAIYVGQILDYAATSTSKAPDLVTEPSNEVFHAVLSEYAGKRSLSAEVALAFIQGLFQLEPSATLTLNGEVHISIGDASFQKMKISDIQRFLGSRSGQPFVDVILNAFADDERAFIAYEVYRARRLTITAAGGQDVAPSFTVGTVGSLPLKEHAGLRYAKLSSEALHLEGDRPYAFAVRTGELKPGRTQGSVQFKETQFTVPGSVIKGVDERYSAPIASEFAPITLRNQ